MYFRLICTGKSIGCLSKYLIPNSDVYQSFRKLSRIFDLFISFIFCTCSSDSSLLMSYSIHYSVSHAYFNFLFVGHGGALVETTPFDRRVAGSNPALAAM